MNIDNHQGESINQPVNLNSTPSTSKNSGSSKSSQVDKKTQALAKDSMGDPSSNHEIKAPLSNHGYSQVSEEDISSFNDEMDALIHSMDAENTNIDQQLAAIKKPEEQTTESTEKSSLSEEKPNIFKDEKTEIYQKTILTDEEMHNQLDDIIFEMEELMDNPPKKVDESDDEFILPSTRAKVITTSIDEDFETSADDFTLPSSRANVNAPSIESDFEEKDWTVEQNLFKSENPSNPSVINHNQGVNINPVKETSTSKGFFPSLAKIADFVKVVFNKVSKLTKTSVSFVSVLKAYNPIYQPKMNKANLDAYSRSADFKRHAATAKVYYNAEQLKDPSDALRVISQREPTNIAMGPNQYNQKELKKQFGYAKGVYNDDKAVKKDGHAFKELPNTASVYSETYLWPNPPNAQKIEIACLSVPAPALDSAKQPHFDYYMKDGRLDEKKYEQEMEFLFRTIESALRENVNSAFANPKKGEQAKGIQRIVLSKFGQGAFLAGVQNPEDKKLANQAYKNQLQAFVERVKDLGIPVVMSEYITPSPEDTWHEPFIVGDILKTAQEGDFIVNSWDPHSAPGNGNDFDKSFDGAMGKSSGILLCQTSWLNENLKSKNALRAVE